MHTGWVPPARWVYGVATLLSTFSSLQSYRLSTLSAPDPSKVEVWPLFVLNFAYWFVPAALTTTIFRFARRVGRGSLPRAIAQHGAAVLAFSVVHLCSMLAVRQLLWGSIAPPTGTLATAVQRT